MGKKYVIEYEEKEDDWGEPLKMVAEYEVDPPKNGTDVIMHFLETHDMEKIASFTMKGVK